MSLFAIIATLVVISALLGCINMRFLKMPTTIGLIVIIYIIVVFSIIVQGLTV